MSDDDNHYFLNLYKSNFYLNSTSTIIEKRNELYQSINGDAFYELHQWPSNISLFFWKKPITDQETFKLFLFFCGNGGSPDLIGRWILSSQHWTNITTQNKRAKQLDFIYNNMDIKNNIWFYFDLIFNDWRYFNGTKRTINSN